MLTIHVFYVHTCNIIFQDNFQVLGGIVDIDFSRHRQIGEKKLLSEDRDWSCFKVSV